MRLVGSLRSQTLSMALPETLGRNLKSERDPSWIAPFWWLHRKLSLPPVHNGASCALPLSLVVLLVLLLLFLLSVCDSLGSHFGRSGALHWHRLMVIIWAPTIRNAPRRICRRRESSSSSLYLCLSSQMVCKTTSRFRFGAMEQRGKAPRNTLKWLI